MWKAIRSSHISHKTKNNYKCNSFFSAARHFRCAADFFVRTVSISPQIAIIFYIFCIKINKNHKVVSKKKRKDSVKVLYFFSKHGIITIRQRHCRRSEPVTTEHKKTNILHSAEKRGAYENTHHCIHYSGNCYRCARNDFLRYKAAEETS